MKQWTLGDMIDAIAKEATPGGWCYTALGHRPGDWHSYRGYYDQLALDWSEDRRDVMPPMSMEEFGAATRACLGRVFTGYKGGEYAMNRSTPLWLSTYGDASGVAIVGLAAGESARARGRRVVVGLNRCARAGDGEEGEMTKKKRTGRGFRVYAELRDSDGNTLRVVQSSAGGMRHVRIYTTNARGAEVVMFPGDCTGWHDVPNDPNARPMYASVGPHLAPGQVRRLIRALQTHLGEIEAAR